MGRKIYANNPEDIWYEAQIFEKSSAAINNSSIKEKDPNVIISMSFAADVNHAYAVELYLKCLLVIEYGYFYTGHELLELFQSLPKETQEEIINNHDTLTIKRNMTYYGLWDNGDFLKSLTEGSKVFMDYRYLFENKKTSKGYDMSFPLMYIKAMIIKKRPEFDKI